MTDLTVTETIIDKQSNKSGAIQKLLVSSSSSPSYNSTHSTLQELRCANKQRCIIVVYFIVSCEEKAKRYI